MTNRECETTLLGIEKPWQSWVLGSHYEDLGTGPYLVARLDVGKAARPLEVDGGRVSVQWL